MSDAREFEAFHAGHDFLMAQRFGAQVDGQGVRFTVWAPDAESVAVIGDFNGWDGAAAPLERLTEAGVWSGRVEGARLGQLYKYRLRSRHQGLVTEKADPVGFGSELPPGTASCVESLDYRWGDAAWLARRGGRQSLEAPMSIYEVHLGSWRRVPAEGNRWLGYRELAPLLIDHARRLGFTHLEFLPLMEHPFYGSWGYQVTGFFAASHRYGRPSDLMYLIDQLHQADLGVILDWVPAHFPTDAHGLGFFDGSHLYEHADRRQGFHPEWNTFVFNYGRNEVRSFLLSSAHFWLSRFHADALRVDGVSSMLYLDYARPPNAWVPNARGGHENLEAIELLRELNATVYRALPDVQTIAEESTAWPMVSRPTAAGGLGFGLKWDMGWMHDTLSYLARDPIYRRYHQGELTFRAVYAYTENFVLPLSHDEVVYGKGSLLEKMPGDEWQKFANLRLLLANLWAQPGKKLLFMGGEFGQRREWSHEASLDWHLLDLPAHRGVQLCVGELNRIYRSEPGLHRGDANPFGFSWIDNGNADQSVLVFSRQAANPAEQIVVALNFTPVPRENYRLGVDRLGSWREIFNSDALEFGGSGWGNLGGAEALPLPWNGRRQSLTVTLPPLAAVFFKPG